MTTRIILFVFASLLAISTVSGATNEVDRKNLDAIHVRQLTAVGYREGEIIVKYKNNTSQKTISQFHQATGSSIRHDFLQLRSMQVIKNDSDITTEELLARYHNNPNVEYAEPNYIFRIQIEPNDAQYPQMWGLNNIGQTGGTPDADINAPEAWDITTGSADVIVASIDTGVDYNHPDLVDNMWVNPGEIAGNNIDDDNNGYIDDVHGINTIDGSGDPMDDNGHGTHTAGTMAARSNNSIGISGISWNSKIVACKFLSEFGSGTTSGAIQCLDYLLDLKTRANNPVNVAISNNSWGGGGFSQALRDAIEAHQNADILFVASAGNAASNNDDRASYPAAYNLPGIVAVAATDHNDNLAFFSNFGRASVDVGAPGLDILSTFPMGTCSLCEDNSGYGTISGTSMAAPHVAGLAALLKAQNPNRDIFAIKNLLMSAGTVTSGTDGVVLSSRRIRAADSNGQGSLTCNNQELREFLLPPTIITTANTTIPVNALQINCAEALSDPVEVTVLPDNNVVMLLDDGSGVDQIAGDGIASGQIIPSVTGSLELPNNESIPINIVNNYGHPNIATANYRALNSNTEQSLNLGLDTFAKITSPFPIKFGGDDNAFTTLYAMSHGVITFDPPTINYINSPLPVAAANTWLAPYWDDIWPGAFANGDNVFWEVQGSAPDRELIIEYRNLTHFSLQDETQSITFQVVFFENSSDVLFNYADVNFSDAQFNHGALATIGLQVANNEARQFSINSAGAITGGQALLWEQNNFVDINLGADQIVNQGEQATLDGTAVNSSELANIVSYQWSQVLGPSVILDNAGTATATFTAPNASAVLQFDLRVTDGNGVIGNGRINVRTNSAPQASADAFGAVNFGESALLFGSNSFDPEDNLNSFQWTQTNGTPVQLTGADSMLAFFTAPDTAQILTFELTVTDSFGLSASDSVDIRVNDPPSANAGSDQTVRVNNEVFLQATAADSDGFPQLYQWQQISGPTVTLSNANVASPSFTPNTPGTYQFQVEVFDNNDASDTDDVNITVSSNSKKSGGATGWLLLTLLILLLLGAYRQRAYPPG